MKEVTLGRSGIVTGNVGFECGPLLKRSFADCRGVMERAIDAGVRFFDIGLPVEELQKRVGHSTVGHRNDLILAGSFEPCKPQEFKDQLKMVLRALKTDYLDLCQIHDPDYLPRMGDSEGFFDALTEAKKAGYIRSIGITTGSEDIALHALEFGWYDTLQFPRTADSEELALDYLTFTHGADMGSISVPQPYPEDVQAVLKEMNAMAEYDAHVSLWLLEEGPGMDQVLAALKTM